MSKKRDRELENALRKEEAKRRRTERVLSGYIKICHPEIYGEAYQFYQHLDDMYPNKKDLRKTPAFMSLKDKYTKSNKPAERVKVHHTLEKTVTDNLVLQIPLMQRKTTAVRETSTTTTNVQETSDPPPSEETIVETTVETTAGLPPIDDATLEEVIADLSVDPNIQNFFDSLDFEFDDCPLW